ncbi:hypothetical protein [Prevotella sp.]|uniref:hypothetical protein n=1 Tax=Prevotella sp. TaxID=59823 RepID=UPI0027E26B3F|nr:hypothetical protein [Prevotella sp.]
MIKTLRFTLMAVMMLICGAISAQTVVTFTAGTDKSEGATLTKDGITLTLEEGTSASGLGKLATAEYRLYKGNILTVSSTIGNITNIEFTCTANNTSKYGPGCFAAQNGYTFKDKVGTWVGNATSVVFTAETAQVRAKTIKVTVGGAAGETKKAAKLAFSEEKVNHEVGTDFTSPTFSWETTATVKFSSDNEAVATVNAEGVISLGTEEGKAVITAEAAENDKYAAGKATCTIYVWHYVTYKKATEIVSGEKYLIVAQRDGKTYYAMPQKAGAKYGYLLTQMKEGTLDELKVESSYDDNFVFAECEDGYSIQDCYGRYLYMDDDPNHKSFQLGTEPVAWEVEASDNGTFSITNNGQYIQFGEGTFTSFGAYSTEQANTVLPMLFKMVEGTTGINNIQTTTAVKNNVMYNIAGQRVNKDYKGLVIMNGKKMMVK